MASAVADPKNHELSRGFLDFWDVMNECRRRGGSIWAEGKVFEDGLQEHPTAKEYKRVLRTLPLTVGASGHLSRADKRDRIRIAEEQEENMRALYASAAVDLKNHMDAYEAALREQAGGMKREETPPSKMSDFRPYDDNDRKPSSGPSNNGHTYDGSSSAYKQEAREGPWGDTNTKACSSRTR